jgi:FKBP-type peptidyl-prolyl cis-trans isomerase FkpA
MPYGILMLALAGLTPAVIVFAAIGANVYWIALMTRLRTLLTVPVRIGLVIVMSLTAAACGGTGSSPSTTSAPPSAPYSATDLREGTGATATQGRTVMVAYTGWLYDPTKPESKGTQFDTSTNFSFPLGVGRVIAGWDQGVVGMKVGGQRRLVIPPNLGYGSQMVGSIPPNSTLVFDIMLLNVT